MKTYCAKYSRELLISRDNETAVNFFKGASPVCHIQNLSVLKFRLIMAVSKSQRTKEMSSKNSVTCDLPPEHAISTDHATT